METVIKGKKKIILDMEKVNIHTQMAFIILEIGLKAKCKNKVNFMIHKAIYNIKVNGKMITFKEKESFIILIIMKIG